MRLKWQAERSRREGYRTLENVESKLLASIVKVLRSVMRKGKTGLSERLQ